MCLRVQPSAQVQPIEDFSDVEAVEAGQIVVNGYLDVRFNQLVAGRRCGMIFRPRNQQAA